MVRLGLDDFEGVLRVVRAVGSARHPDEFSRTAITEIASLIPSDVVTINEVDPGAERMVYLAQPESFPIPPGSQRHLAELAHQHPLIHHFVSTGDGSAQRISDFLTQEAFHASPIYRLLYQPMGIEYQMSVVLPAPRPVVVAIVANRRDADFSERERAILNVLRPHLVQAWFNAKDQGHLRSLLNAASEATVDSGAELIVLSDPPHEVTPGALVSLYRYFGRPSQTSPLPARVERWLASQQSRLESPGSLDLLTPLRAEIARRRLVLRYLPGQATHPGALLLREDLGSPQRRSLDALGLTAREAEIVSYIVKGGTNAAIADAMHISPATVKKHLENIYVKLGVRGRGRLTAFVLDLLER